MTKETGVREDENARKMSEIRAAQVEVDARRREVEARADALRTAKANLEDARTRLEETIVGDEGGPLFDPRLQGIGRLEGIPKGAVAPMFDHEIQTVGHLEQFVAAGSASSAVERLVAKCAGSITTAQAELVLEAFAGFQKSGRLEGEIGGTDGEGE